MTFSILVRDASGSFGAAIASSSPAVAARCLTLLDGVGAVSSQNITDPRLGPKIMALMASGLSAEAAISQIASTDPTADYRQILAIDKHGGTGVHSGRNSLGTHGSAHAPSIVTAGNLLASGGVPQAMVDTFTRAEGELEERLLAALRGALAAGGEEGPIRSASLSVVRDVGWRVTDLRVDWDDEPLERLATLVEVWLPQRDDYVTRGIAPDTAPAYGVPGDE
jgi:uncharacterized Ntn-hydrolase superfamily protein